VSKELHKRGLIFGSFLRERREQLRITTYQAAERGGYAKGSLCELEQGLKDPLKISLETVVKLSRAYMIKPEAILRRLGIID
jgi:transcriptional regulator with XRE-family HTH domain